MVEERDLPAGVRVLRDVRCLSQREDAEYGTVPALQLGFMYIHEG